MAQISYVSGSERPDLHLWWRDDDGDLIDFSTATFVVKIGQPGNTALTTKSSGTTGAAGSGTPTSGVPNVVINWASGDLAIAQGQYTLQIAATDGGEVRYATLPITIRAAVL